MKKIILGILRTLSLVGLFLFASNGAVANPSYFITPTKTATATSTHVYMTSGNATTTISVDAYANGNSWKTKQAQVSFQMTATGTAPVLLARVENSDDNIDWYSQTIETTANTAVTTYAPKSMSYTFASSSAYFSSGSVTRMNQSITIDTPARYTRVVFYSTNANAFDLWAQVQSIKEESK